MLEGTRRLLECLRDSGSDPLSDDELSARLGISRAQAWKHVSTLREGGYVIEGKPGEGYSLLGSPDRLNPKELSLALKTRWLGRKIEYLEETDSTNRVAADLAREGAPHGTAVIAESQTAGRGRLGRSFFSPPNTNLYTSIVLRPDLDVASAPSLLLAAGVAVAESVLEELGETAELEIKWPNDVLLGGLKTSGILMELDAKEDRVEYAILGIGVNLNVERERFPEEFRRRATSLLSHSGRHVDRMTFTQRLYRILEDVLDAHAGGGLARLRPRFERHFHMRGRRITVAEVGGGLIEGIAAGIAPSGALEIDLPSGKRMEVLAGDVTICKDDPPKE